MEKKLYRSRDNKVISGVCGGIATYFDVDATFIRLLWAVTVLLGGTGIVAYILCIIIIPEQPRRKVDDDVVMYDEDEVVVGPLGEESDESDESEETNSYVVEEKSTRSSGYAVGIAFIAVGLMFMARRIFWWFNIDFAWELFWPAVLVLFGMYLIFKKRG
jgi:phage shock protein PspC (stress-responsive transcriptional regulator)